MTPTSKALAILMSLAASQTAAFADTLPKQRTISVSATGQVSATPDIARITAGVTSDAPTAAGALTANNTAMAKVITAIKAAGVAPADIQTTAINVQPRYQSVRPGEPATLQGFTVNNQVRFVYRKIEALGGILDTVVKAGANQIHGIGFEISNNDDLLDQARTKAMAAAFKRAALYAKAAGSSLGEVLNIDEGTNTEGPVPYFRTRAATASAVPVEPGSQTLSIAVNVTYAIK